MCSTANMRIWLIFTHQRFGSMCMRSCVSGNHDQRGSVHDLHPASHQQHCTVTAEGTERYVPTPPGLESSFDVLGGPDACLTEGFWKRTS